MRWFFRLFSLAGEWEKQNKKFFSLIENEKKTHKIIFIKPPKKIFIKWIVIIDFFSKNV